MSPAAPHLDRPSAWRGFSGTEWFDAPLAAYTSWRVGGPADRLYLPADAPDLGLYLQTVPVSEPVFWLGLGSNLLVRDGGIRGVVICTKNRLRRIERLDGARVFAQTGVPCAHIARFCADAGWEGGEFLAGIPGTLGGALAMNAGAFGGETWELVERLQTIDRHGVCRWRSPAEFTIGYRSVIGLPVDEWYVGAELSLRMGDTAVSRGKIRELLARRASTQPTNLPSCGSTFRNPPGDHAGRLIEACGLKGFQIGGAQVSPKHANFIVNLGHASADDIERVLLHVRSEVSRQCGVNLHPEVRIVGESLTTREVAT
jgi:UDP-N-acetylmuramate dehydrogenase